jgi:virginiamycin B lyase
MWRRALARPAALLALALVAGCSGSGSGLPASPAQSQSGSHKSAKVTFTMHWNSSTTSSAKVHRAYVPSTALSVSIAVNGGTPQYLNAPLTSITIDAPVGTDLFTFQTYDQPSGEGYVLSQANVTQAIIDGDANVVSAVLDGVIASLALSLSNASPNAGAPATVAIQATAEDADGNTIIGSSNYSSPIVLAISDPSNSGTVSLSAKTIVSPAGTSNLVYNGGTLWSASVSASAIGVAPVNVTFAPKPTFYTYSVPTVNSFPQFITAGKDGNMWFTEAVGDKIGKITPTGTVTEYSIPTFESFPEGITQGSDGRLWFAENEGNKIGAMTTGGAFTEYPVDAGDMPSQVFDRGDGNIWYGAPGGNHIGYQAETNDSSSETPITLSGSAAPFGLAEGSDGNLYFAENGGNAIGYITGISSVQQQITLPEVGSEPAQMVRGPDGQLWFAEEGDGGTHNGGKIGVIATSSGAPYVSAEYPTVSPDSAPIGITVGTDGALWFTEHNADAIGRVTTTGVVTEYKSPITGLNLYGIAAAANGTLWFCEFGTGGAGHIGELVY